MRTILVPFCDDDRAEAALQTALSIAGRYDGHVEGLHAWRTPQIIAGEGVVFPSESLARLTDESKQFAASAHQRFDAVIKAADIPYRAIGAAADGVSCSWREGEGVESEIVGDYGRLFNMIVMGRNELGTSVDWKATLEAALFESGRPVLIVPHSPPPETGERVALAWNDSIEASRAVAAAMPVLRGAGEVIVLRAREKISAEDKKAASGEADDLVRYLAWNGIAAEARCLDAAGESEGGVLLAAAVAWKADLLVMGGYTHSRFRQMLIGGVTRHMLTEAEVPVLMAH